MGLGQVAVDSGSLGGLGQLRGNMCSHHMMALRSKQGCTLSWELCSNCRWLGEGLRHIVRDSQVEGGVHYEWLGDSVWGQLLMVIVMDSDINK